jgi:hypothetical protein
MTSRLVDRWVDDFDHQRRHQPLDGVSDVGRHRARAPLGRIASVRSWLSLEAETAASASAFSAASIALSSDSGILGMLVCPAVVTGRGGTHVGLIRRGRGLDPVVDVSRAMAIGSIAKRRPAPKNFSACEALSKKPGCDVRWPQVGSTRPAH